MWRADQRRLRHLSGTRAVLLAGLVSAGMACGPVPRAGATTLTAFDHDPVVAAAELANLRGGFMMPNGVTIRFGFEIQQLANNVVQNDVAVGPVVLANGVLQQHLNITQTTPGGTQTTQLSQLPNGGFSFPVVLNSGLTNLNVTIRNGSVQTIIQNAANNQALQSVTTVNLSTQGFAHLLHSTMSTAQILNVVRNSTWTAH